MIMVCTPIEKNTEFLPLGVPGTLHVRYSEVHVLSIINSHQCFDPKTILIAIRDRSISIGGMGRSICKSGGQEMHNPPSYVGINSADPPQSIG